MEKAGDSGPDSRLLGRAALWGFGLIIAAAGLLWLRFGTAVFIDSLSFIRSCF